MKTPKSIRILGHMDLWLGVMAAAFFTIGGITLIFRGRLDLSYIIVTTVFVFWPITAWRVLNGSRVARVILLLYQIPKISFMGIGLLWGGFYIYYMFFTDDAKQFFSKDSIDGNQSNIIHKTVSNEAYATNPHYKPHVDISFEPHFLLVNTFQGKGFIYFQEDYLEINGRKWHPPAVILLLLASLPFFLVPGLIPLYFFGRKRQTVQVKYTDNLNFEVISKTTGKLTFSNNGDITTAVIRAKPDDLKGLASRISPEILTTV